MEARPRMAEEKKEKMESTAAFDGTEVANDAERRVGAGIFHYDVGDGFGETEDLKGKRKGGK